MEKRVYVAVTDETGVLVDHFVLASECMTGEALGAKVRELVVNEAEASAGFGTFWVTDD